MAQKQVRICDRCGLEREFFSTTEWTEVTIALPILEGKAQETKHDLCDSCTSALRAFVTTTPARAEGR